ACDTTTTTLRFVDNRNGTVTDHQTGLQWEMKNAYDYQQNAFNLHDTDNLYPWAGRCSVAPHAFCQTTGGASALCFAHSDGGNGACEMGASGTCDIFGYMTVWEWLDNLNSINFAGHNDWRLPSEGGHNGSPPTGSNELETILEKPCRSSDF